MAGAKLKLIQRRKSDDFTNQALSNDLKIKSKLYDYSVSTVSGHSTTLTGRIAKGLTIKGVGEMKVYRLPNLYEAAFIPDSTDEVITPGLARDIPSLAPFANKFIQRLYFLNIHLRIPMTESQNLCSTQFILIFTIFIINLTG